MKTENLKTKETNFVNFSLRSAKNSADSAAAKNYKITKLQNYKITKLQN